MTKKTILTVISLLFLSFSSYGQADYLVTNRILTITDNMDR